MIYCFYKKNIGLLFGLFLIGFSTLNAQVETTQDSTIVLSSSKRDSNRVEEPKKPFLYFLKETDPSYNPQKALFWGLVLPSGGQIFNKDYWKAPIALGAIGTAVYFTIENRNNYERFRDAYRLRVDGDDNTVDEFADNPNATNDVLVEIRDRYHKWFEQSIMASVAVYGLTAIEAFTSAHLKDFDISDDLSMRVHPSIKWQTITADTQGMNLGVGVKVFIKGKTPLIALDFME